MSVRKPRRERPPLNAGTLNELALRYVGRFATTRAKLKSYLSRKVRERGWGDGPGPDLEMLVERFAASGYVDDAGYALSKSRSLLARGYGKQRVVQSLRVAGVGDDDGAEARAHADQEAVTAALRYARRKRIGPYAPAQADMAARQKALAAMVRAGHNFTLSRAVIDLPAGEEPDEDVLKNAAGRSTD